MNAKNKPVVNHLTKVTKAEHPRAHFFNMILSQSNGVVLNSTHELYSCKANCISGGSYFRITIALNYSTWLLVIQTGVWSQILLLPLLDLH